jgi:hypothetical protein
MRTSMSFGGGPGWPAWRAAQDPKMTTCSTPSIANSSAMTSMGPKLIMSSWVSGPCGRVGGVGRVQAGPPHLAVADQLDRREALRFSLQCRRRNVKVLDQLGEREFRVRLQQQASKEFSLML